MGKRPKEILHKRRYPNDHKMYRKVHNTFTYQENEKIRPQQQA